MIPHDYQAEAVDVTVSSLQERQQALVIMATGLGKTLIAAITLSKLKRQKQRFRNLLLCHDNEILDQSEPTFRAILGESADIGYFNGETKEGADSEIVFSTFQTLREWKAAFFPDEFDLITVDEAHHSQAMTYIDVIEYFTAPKLGLTAMRDRMDGKDIADIFGEPVVSIPLEEAIPRGLLTPFEYRIVSDGLNTEVVRALTREIESGRRFTLADVNKRLFIKARDKEIVRRIKREVGSRKTLVFCRNILHAEHVADMLGPMARGYHSGASRAVNKDTLNAFRAGTLQFLVSVNKANEGVDIPDAKVVVFLRTTGSKTIFFEQLGRSLRKFPGKDKALILDFVGNVERIVMLHDIVRTIGQNLDVFKYEEKEFVTVSGNDFEFNFNEKVVEVLDLVKRLRREFYETWQEAGAASQALGIKSSSMYLVEKRYKIDPRLPASPDTTYKDFPGWPKFLGGQPKKFYPTWQEASSAVTKMGITNSGVYSRRYAEDKRLPSDPNRTYSDFPGWPVFFGRRPRNFYATWQEAGRAAVRLKIKTGDEYRRRYKEDTRLPSNPNHTYVGFPGWSRFLTKPGIERGFYTNWQRASKATVRLGIKTSTEYLLQRKHKKDPRLPSQPRQLYPDFPGWPIFLGRQKRNFYPRWRTAAVVVRAIGIKSSTDYRRRKPYLQDPRLPAVPDSAYSDFPGWPIFLTGKPKSRYPTWEEASVSAIKLGIASEAEYQRRYKEDVRLPSTPISSYKDFPGWHHFLKKEKRQNFYSSWEEAAVAIRRLGIKSHRDYGERYREDPRLPANLPRTYKDFPGWIMFLRGKKTKD